MIYHTKFRKAGFFLLLLGLSPLLSAQNPGTLEASFQGILNEALAADSTVPGILLHVEAPDQQIVWSGSAGVNDLNSLNELSPEATVRMASNTKTYVAAGILRLWEMGKLDLDDPVSRYIPEEFTAILSEDDYDMDAITIRHLLTHTSGLFDHAGQTYIRKVFSDPSHRWTRTEQLKGCVEWGDKLFEPGQGFSYSDTGYILLGRILEELTGKIMGAALRGLLRFEELGITSTWHETFEEKPVTASPRAHQYFMQTDTYDFDPSLDLYGGGGLVASTGDMARFYQALFNDRIFDDPNTLEVMKEKPLLPEDYEPRFDYRKGLFYFERFGLPEYSHSGFWGTNVIYLPSLNATISIAVTQFNKGRLSNQVLMKVIEELH